MGRRLSSSLYSRKCCQLRGFGHLEDRISGSISHKYRGERDSVDYRSTESKYRTVDDLIKDALDRPGKVKMGSAGPEFQDFLKQSGAVSLGLSGEEALKFGKIGYQRMHGCYRMQVWQR
ncbi:hypothetical protein ABHN11_11535 [Brevibacillus centrosporus]|uniref:hypothetical protein n=1 Tax=Brevibacillus centrosporus TaxID=54910 RepID=UPI003D207F7A